MLLSWLRTLWSNSDPEVMRIADGGLFRVAAWPFDDEVYQLTGRRLVNQSYPDRGCDLYIAKGGWIVSRAPYIADDGRVLIPNGHCIGSIRDLVPADEPVHYGVSLIAR